jgi:alpha-1,3-mannosyltransferase
MDDESKFDSDPSTEESYPLLPFTDSPSPERPVFCPPRFKPRRYLSWFHSLLLRNRRATFLASLTAVATLISTIYFRFPSTLHLYLSLLLVSIPTSLVIDLSTLPFDCGKRWSRTRFFAFVIPLASFLFIIIPSLLLPIIPGVQDVKPVATLLSDMPIFPANHTYFFAMNLYNSAALFPTFQTSLLSLIGALGEENVFVSIYESNSKDNTKELLVDLERELRRRNVGCRIEMDNEGERLNDNWAGVKYLADVRNRALKPLDEGINGVNGRTFTRVVWLNDIYYDWSKCYLLQLRAPMTDMPFIRICTETT